MNFIYPFNVNFVCERCGKCCGDDKGRIRKILFLNIEARRISVEYLMNISNFAKEVYGFEPYVYEMKKNDKGCCIFLKSNNCSIYPLRPLICRFYPFQLYEVKNNLFNFSCTDECPGIGKGYPLQKVFFKNLFDLALELMSKNSKN